MIILEILLTVLKSIKMKIIFLVVFVSLMLHASSQDSSHIQYNKLTTKFFFRIRLNGKAINNYELKRELRKAPEAWAYYKQYSRRLIIGSSLLVPSILFNSLGDKDRLLGKGITAIKLLHSYSVSFTLFYH
jgi:hypothetical protein